MTSVIGNEFVKGSCSIVDDILNAPNADQRIRDLAIMGKTPAFESIAKYCSN